MSNKDPTGLFEDDDEETWNLLVSATPSTAVASRLASLAVRFREDEDDSHKLHWKELLATVKGQGFHVPESSSTPPEPSSITPGRNDAFPAAFQSEAGKDHITATASLLRVSEKRAVQLTLSALRAVTVDVISPEKAPHFQSLLGTRALLKTVARHHFKQRLARLQVVAECLRMEQDEGTQDRDLIVETLDSLDSTVNFGGRKRGLFRRLVSICCKPDSLPSRQELLPTRKLRDDSLSHPFQRADNSLDGNSSWNSFAAECMEASKRQIHQERLQAMEALLLLLYDRINDGIYRVDFAIILAAFQSRAFFTEYGDRLGELAGLVCSECMGLWRFYSSNGDGSDSLSCVTGHPFLAGVVSVPGMPRGFEREAEQELETLRTMLSKLSAQVLDRRKHRLAATSGRNASDVDGFVVDAPESLALLSFGLLLRLTYTTILQSEIGSDSEAYWRDFDSHGMECITQANDEGGAFSFLHAVMEKLVSPSPAPNTQVEAGSATIAYASIGREVLISTVSSFQDTILSNLHQAACENIGMLCSLASVIYKNHPVLCEQFWVDWDSYTKKSFNEERGVASGDPLCYLLEAAYNLSVSALNAVSGAAQQTGLEEALLPALEPLLRLVSSLCSSCALVESVICILPDGMIRTALLCCSPSSDLSDERTFVKLASSVLDSVATLNRIGNSSDCRRAMRNALEVPCRGQIDGPRILFRIISASSRSDLIAGALHVTADLLEFSDGESIWVLSAAKFFAHSSGFGPLISSGNKLMTLAAVRVLKGFVFQLTGIVFCQSSSERDISEYIHTMLRGTLVACEFLSGMLAASGRPLVTPTTSVPYPVALKILELIGQLLNSLRPIGHLHGTPSIRSAAVDTRNTLIETLATSAAIGESISYFATAPVSLSLAAALSKHLDEAQVLNLASNEDAANKEANKYGAWRSFLSEEKADSRENVPSTVSEYLDKVMSGTQTLTLEMEAVHMLAWIGHDAQVCLETAKAAMELLMVWGMHVQDIVQRRGYSSQMSIAKDDLHAFGPYRLLTSLAVVPPPVRENQTLFSVWPREKLSNLSLMLRYLSKEASNDFQSSSTTNRNLSSLSIELLRACFRYGNVINTTRNAASPSLSLQFGSAQYLHHVLHWSLNDVVKLSTNDARNGAKVQVDETILLLRMLFTCVEARHPLADYMLLEADTEPSPVIDLVVENVSNMVGLIKQKGANYIQQARGNHQLMDQLRIASECLNILSEIWYKARATEENRSLAKVREWVTGVASDSTKSSFLSDVVDLVMNHSNICQIQDGDEIVSSERYKRGVLMNIMAKSLDIVSLEIAESIKSPSTDKDFAGVLLQRGRKSDALVVSLSKSFTAFDGPRQLAKWWRGLLRSPTIDLSRKAIIEERQPDDFLLSFPASSPLVIDDNSWGVRDAVCFLGGQSGDAGAETLGLTSSHDWSELKPEVHELVSNVHVSWVLLEGELKLIFSWKRFAERLLQKDPSWESLALAQETCRALHRNLEATELSLLDIPDVFLSSESGDMACTLTSLLLHSLEHYVALSESLTPSVKESMQISITEMLMQLHASSDKIFSLLCQSPAFVDSSNTTLASSVDGGKVGLFKTFCVLQQNLLASAIVLLRATERSARENFKRFNDSSIGFVDTACKTVRLVEPVALSSNGDSKSFDLLHKAVDLLTLLVSPGTSSPTPGTGPSLYFSHVAESIRKYEAIKSLVRQVRETSAWATTAVSVARNEGPTQHQHRDMSVGTIRSIFLFIAAIAEAGVESLDMLLLLTDSSMSQLFLNNPLFLVASEQWLLAEQTYSSLDPTKAVGKVKHDRNLRGYLPTESTSKLERQKSGITEVSGGRFFAGKDDPVHEIWRIALRVLLATVRSSRHTNSSSQSERMNSYYVQTALDFLQTNEASLRSCLRQCASVPFGEKPMPSFSLATAATSMNSHSVVFTLNALREARDILSLISELCSGMNRNQFERVTPGLYKEFVQASLDMTRSLGQFLGAASASRDLFIALAEFNSDEFVPSEDSVLDYSKVLEGGIPNARHEAIRNAHYAIRCCAFVTAADYAAFSISRGSSTPRSSDGSADDLEKTCQFAVNSEFVLKMEQAASECLFHAVSVLWETHPASSVFVMFTPEELSRVDAMSLVKMRMIIALRNPDARAPDRALKSTLHWSTPASSIGTRGRDLRFARVLESDTVRRVWRVQYLESSDAQSVDVVSADLLAGVEDIHRAVCMFEYSYAESASAIESAGGACHATLGHLILALRWCYQYSSIPESQGHYALIQRLAHLTSLLLGTETSLHKEIGTTKIVPDEVSKRVGHQLLELFGDRPSLSRDEGPVLGLGKTEAMAATGKFPEGRLKRILDNTTWETLQRQLGPELEAAKELQDKSRGQNEQSAIGNASPYRKSGFFRGLSL